MITINIPDDEIGAEVEVLHDGQPVKGLTYVHLSAEAGGWLRLFGEVRKGEERQMVDLLELLNNGHRPE